MGDAVAVAAGAGAIVHGYFGEAHAGVGMAFAAGGLQVVGVDRRLGVVRRQNIVHSVTGGAVCGDDGTVFDRHAVVGVFIAETASRFQTVAAGDALVFVALNTGRAGDSIGVDRRQWIGGRTDFVLAVAIDTRRCVEIALGRG